MKSYLGLIPISAKVHRRQNRLTLLCIVFSVFLVTAVFSMAEMGARMELGRLVGKHGIAGLQALLGSSMAHTLFGTASVLFLLILAAGVLMIAGSMNSTIAQRTQFFGMMRCLGMSRRQIRRFVRLEALNWCKTAIPVGVLGGVAASWGLCAVLRFVVGEGFADIPLFGVSLVGIFSGALMGAATVLLAARSPAKRAAAVSPVVAVSGNAAAAAQARPVLSRGVPKIETALGIHHAVSDKKNLLLMTGSFALSIVLFLTFSVMLDLVGYIMPQSAATPDLEIAADAGNTLEETLLTQISGMPGVKRVFGRRNSTGVLAEIKGTAGAVDLVAYSDFDLDCLANEHIVRKGGDLSKVYGDNRCALAVPDRADTLAPGDTIRVGDETIEIAGVLKHNPFSEDGSADEEITLITSGETFTRLTGEAGYSLVLVQTTKAATDDEVDAIRRAAGTTCQFADRRDQRTGGTYLAFCLFVYGFLAVLGAVTVLNIMNSISMSVSARIRQYGAMRAIGMDARQLTKMIAAEALTYALCGCGVGCLAGLLLSRQLYTALITRHYPYAVWSVPALPLAVVLLLSLAATVMAVYAPAKRIRQMAITETINEL